MTKSDNVSAVQNLVIRDRVFGITVVCALIVGGLMVSLGPSPQEEESQQSHHVSSSGPMPDFERFNSVKEKKRAFISFLLPKVEEVNSKIIDERMQLQKYALRLESGRSLSSSQQRKLARLAASYDVDADAMLSWDLVQKLMRRIDIVPPSLVISQSATESAWGTSRFAREGYNLFGIWCFTPGCGIVPGRRIEGADHEVAVYDSPEDALENYIHILNTHPAYREFRDLRETLRQKDDALDGTVLAEGLSRYSERGDEYVEELRFMMRINNMTRFDAPEAGEPVSAVP